MIIMKWRGLVLAQNYLGEVSLGYGSSYTVENGTRTIKTGYGGNNGSGFTAQSWGERSVNYNFHTPIHEYGHWLLGGSHPYGSGSERNVWGMMYHSSDGICANAYERERVAWINPTIITTDILNAPINDYITTGSAYKYHPPNGSSDEYYYFENHQKLGSVYDDATSNQNDKGIFVVHQQGPYASNNNIRCKPANGQWDWNDPFTATCWGNVLPSWEMAGVNRNEYSNRDQLPKTGGGFGWLYALIDEDGAVQCGDYLHGWGLNNSFNLEYNDVFSPYSNPRTHTWANTQINFTMEIFDQNGSIINAKFYITNPIDGKPSKPSLGWDPTDYGMNYIYGWIYLAWGADFWDGDPIEPDYEWSELQRKIGSGSWVTVYSGPNRVWSDGSVTYDPDGTIPVYFRVRVRDTQDLWSVWSDAYSTNMINQVQQKYNSGMKSKDVPLLYSLQQNFPNPFNPSTRIDYSIKKGGMVTLKVYDILGTEVATLVSARKNVGNFSVEFDASNLPSGIYFYKLTAGSFTSAKKLLLLK